VLEALLGGETLGGILDEELPDEVLGCVDWNVWARGREEGVSQRRLRKGGD
jgi:hypothetical protein